MANFTSHNQIRASITRLKVRKAKAEEAKIPHPIHDIQWLNGVIHGLELAIAEFELLMKEDQFWNNNVIQIMEKTK